MYTTELDINHEMPQANVLAFAAQNNCAALLIEESGPAGGNPLYQFFSNSYDSLLQLATEVLDDEEHAASKIDKLATQCA